MGDWVGWVALIEFSGGFDLLHLWGPPYVFNIRRPSAVERVGVFQASRLPLMNLPNIKIQISKYQNPPTLLAGSGRVRLLCLSTLIYLLADLFLKLVI